jgi:hypothetical protein
MKPSLKNLLAVCALASTCATTNAITFGVDPGMNWIGYMNVFEIPLNGGGYLWGSPWGTADLCANTAGGVLTLSPNTIGDPSPYWYIPSGGPGAVGNKIMGANYYIEDTGGLAGQTVTFSGTVLANTLVGQVNQLGDGWTAEVFIKDFAPDYSWFASVAMPLTPGPFSISLNTIADPARHVQLGFNVTGPDVWITDVGPYGNIQIAAVPEPGTLALLGLGLAMPLILRRRQ